MTLLILALIIASPIVNFFGGQLADPNFDKVFALLRNKEWIIPLQLFIWTWWLSAAPLFAMLLAPLLKGMKIRSAILWMLVVPILLLICYCIIDLNLKSGFNQAITYFFKHNYLILIISLIGYLLLIIYYFFSKQYDTYMLMLTYQDKMLARKERLPKKITRGSLQLIIILAMLYLLCGLDYIAIFYFATFAMGIVIFSFIAMALFMDLLCGNKE